MNHMAEYEGFLIVLWVALELGIHCLLTVDGNTCQQGLSSYKPYHVIISCEVKET